MEIQAIVIRAPAGLQGASEQESTIKEADYISEMGSLRMYRPVNAQCSSSSQLPKRLPSSHSIVKVPSTFQKAPKVFLPPFFLWGWERGSGGGHMHLCTCNENRFLNVLGKTGRY